VEVESQLVQVSAEEHVPQVELQALHVLDPKSLNSLSPHSATQTLRVVSLKSTGAHSMQLSSPEPEQVAHERGQAWQIFSEASKNSSFAQELTQIAFNDRL
jgi:hypothetical protein